MTDTPDPADEPADERADDPVDDPAATLAPASDPIALARRRHGTAGAVLAAGLFGIDVALGRKPKEEIPVVVASNDEPTDVDADGIALAIDETTSVVSPALPRLDPRTPARRRTRRRR